MTGFVAGLIAGATIGLALIGWLAWSFIRDPQSWMRPPW
jgi:hypothetical protein